MTQGQRLDYKHSKTKPPASPEAQNNAHLIIN